MSESRPFPEDSGFTLVELLLAAASSALILVAFSTGMAVFGDHVQAARADADTGPEEAAALMADMARHAWWVEQPGDHVLELADADGGITRFELEGSTLNLTRASGLSGPLLEGVESMSLSNRTVGRLRDAEPQGVDRSWWEAAPAPGELEAFAIESGLPVALGFTMSSAVPDQYDQVEGVSEHALHATLESLGLAISFVGELPDDPNQPVSGDDDDSELASEDHGKKNKKVSICHVPPGNPEDAHTLSVASAAVDAHLAHGDSLGECSPGDEPNPAEQATLVVELFRARAPDDARPIGPALGTVAIPATYLPTGAGTWVLTSAGEHGDGHDHSPDECASTTPNGKVVMCHVPPGNPGNAHSIEIAPAAVEAHLAHGDYFGCCGDHDGDDQVFTWKFVPPDTQVELNLTPLGFLVEPGVAYTLVLSLQGPGMVQLASVPVASSQNTGLAQGAVPGGPLVPHAAAVAFSLQGNQAITRTEQHDAVSQVSVRIEMESGAAAQGSASITSQTGIPGVWAGVVVGQVGVAGP